MFIRLLEFSKFIPYFKIVKQRGGMRYAPGPMSVLVLYIELHPYAPKSILYAPPGSREAAEPMSSPTPLLGQLGSTDPVTETRTTRGALATGQRPNA